MSKGTPLAFKSKGALAGLFGEKAIAVLNSELGVHQAQIRRWVKHSKGLH